jgi:hypothetical protein
MVGAFRGAQIAKIGSGQMGDEKKSKIGRKLPPRVSYY